MKTQIIKDKRQLIPRWHTSRKSFSLQFPKTKKNSGSLDIGEDIWFSRSLSEWSRVKTVSAATDLLVRITNSENTESKLYGEVVSFLRKNDKKITNEVREIISPKQRYFDSSPTYSTNKKDIYNVISRIKNQLNKYPNDALSWMDLAFYYSSIGQDQQALNSVNIGCHLAPQNPFMIRAKSRFLLHMKGPTLAAKYLSRTDASNSHPLVAAAKLSIEAAFGVGSINPKKIKSLIENNKSQPHLISELAAAYGTLEIMNGANRKGKKYVEESLIFPSENTLSQCVWLKNKAGIDIDSKLMGEQRSTEGEVTEAYIAKNFSLCREKLIELHAFQPFSDNPIVSAGYVCLTALDDYDFVIEMSEGRIPLSNMSFMELNNLVVAYLMKGSGARSGALMNVLFDKAMQDKESFISTLGATTGLFLMLNGFVDEGCNLYENVLSKFKRLKDDRQLALANFFYSRAIKGFDRDRSHSLMETSKKLAKKNGLSEISDSKCLSSNQELELFKIPNGKPQAQLSKSAEIIKYSSLANWML